MIIWSPFIFIIAIAKDNLKGESKRHPENMSVFRKSFFSYGEKNIQALYRNTNPRLKTIV